MEIGQRLRRVELRLIRLQTVIDSALDFQLCWQAWDWRTSRVQKKLSPTFKRGTPPESSLHWVFWAAGEAPNPHCYESELVLLVMRQAGEKKKIAGRCALNVLSYLNSAEPTKRLRLGLQRCPDRSANIEIELRIEETGNFANSFTNASSLGGISLEFGGRDLPAARSTAMRLVEPTAIQAISPKLKEAKAEPPAKQLEDNFSFAKLNTENDVSSSTNDVSGRAPEVERRQHTSRGSTFSFKQSHDPSSTEASRGLRERLVASEALNQSLNEELRQLRAAPVVESDETTRLREELERLQRESKVMQLMRQEKIRIYEKRLKETEELSAQQEEELKQKAAIESELETAKRTIAGQHREIQRCEREFAVSERKLALVREIVSRASEQRTLSTAALLHELSSVLNLTIK